MQQSAAAAPFKKCSFDVTLFLLCFFMIDVISCCHCRLQRYYWLQRNNSQKVPNHLQKLERLIFSLPQIIILEIGTTFFFLSTSLLESCCVKQRMKSARGSVGFFSSSVLPLDTLNTHCVNLISKTATICLEIIHQSVLKNVTINSCRRPKHLY